MYLKSVLTCFCIFFIDSSSSNPDGTFELVFRNGLIKNESSCIVATFREIGMDPMQMPNISRPFDVELQSGGQQVTFDLFDGVSYGLSSLTTIGDAGIFFEDRTMRIHGRVYLDEVKSFYSYHARSLDSARTFYDKGLMNIFYRNLTISWALDFSIGPVKLENPQLFIESFQSIDAVLESSVVGSHDVKTAAKIISRLKLELLDLTAQEALNTMDNAFINNNENVKNAVYEILSNIRARIEGQI